MKKETIILVITGALLFGVVALIIEKNTASKKTVPVTESTTQQVVAPTSAPAILDNEQTEPSITNKQKETMKKQYDKAPAMTIDATKKYQATLKTSEGDIVVELFADKTPKTVNNFVFLANEGFYNETIFHRAINGFMIQGGDPEGTGMGGPGYRFADEEFEGKYSRGTIAMANAGANTNGSQFFIMHQDYPLPANYVIFGKVTKGLEAVDAIATAPVTASSSGENSKPVTPATVESITIK
jgi:cyclophilin family peptidyl-prolyl cis-trans isomerase